MITAVMLLCLILSGCARVIDSEKDEIRLSKWEGAYENGKTVALRFEDSSAFFSVRGKDIALDIEGLCSLTDDSFMIFDEKSGLSYRFDYILHGDRIELSYRGDSIELEKKVEE